MLNLIEIRCYFYIFSLDDASVIFNICNIYLTDIYCYKEKITQNICIFSYIKYVTNCTYFFNKINIYNVNIKHTFYSFILRIYILKLHYFYVICLLIYKLCYFNTEKC